VENYKLITCITPSKKGLEIIERLKKEKNIITANKSYARGSLNIGSKIKYEEVEVIGVVVKEGEADDVFAFLYEIAEINRPHNGYIFQNVLTRSTEYSLPEVKNKSDEL